MKIVFLDYSTEETVIYNQKTWKFVRNAVPLQTKKQNCGYEKNQNATFGKNHHCHPAGRSLRQFLQ